MKKKTIWNWIRSKKPRRRHPWAVCLTNRQRLVELQKITGPIRIRHPYPDRHTLPKLEFMLIRAHPSTPSLLGYTPRV